MSKNLREIKKERDEKIAEIEKKYQAERQERFMYAKRVLPQLIVDKVAFTMANELDRDSLFLSLDDMANMMCPRKTDPIFFWRTVYAWKFEDAEDAVRNVLGEVSERLADQGLYIDRYAGFSIRIRWDQLK